MLTFTGGFTMAQAGARTNRYHPQQLRMISTRGFSTREPASTRSTLTTVQRSSTSRHVHHLEFGQLALLESASPTLGPLPSHHRTTRFPTRRAMTQKTIYSISST